MSSETNMLGTGTPNLFMLTTLTIMQLRTSTIDATVQVV